MSPPSLLVAAATLAFPRVAIGHAEEENKRAKTAAQRAPGQKVGVQTGLNYATQRRRINLLLSMQRKR